MVNPRPNPARNPEESVHQHRTLAIITICLLGSFASSKAFVLTTSQASIDKVSVRGLGRANSPMWSRGCREETSASGRRQSCLMQIPYLDGFPDVYHQRIPKYKVILMRHGESEWNRDNRFLGWADIGLTEEGEREAKQAAQTLLDFGIDVDEMVCSYLKRSIKTGCIVADGLDKAWMPMHKDWRLNEQMYGALQGLNKRATAERFGVALTQKWRRSYDLAPPAVAGGHGYFPPDDAKYVHLTDDDIPNSWCGSANTESLKDAQTRVWAMWKEVIVPLARSGKVVLVCGHGNVIRALLKRLDSLPNGVLKQVSIPRATPLVYDLDKDMVPVPSPYSLGPLSGRFLGNPIALAKALQKESPQAQLGPVTSADDVVHSAQPSFIFLGRETSIRDA
ncbi:unnamed protein product [Choristocarpus tenellus]